ncbi:MAG: hypothetical protein EOP39_08420 [Rubrivivax sp.]|nr:MAG: hypothetical protein EOP39_08420 [Rubrivivax sp.]
MKPADDPFLPLHAEEVSLEFANLVSRPAAVSVAEATPQAFPTSAPAVAPVVARFEGFDLLDQPLVSGVPGCPGQTQVARSTVPLRSAHKGQSVVLLFENGDLRLPLIMGLLGPAAEPATPAAMPTVLSDGERQVIEAEREIVLRCGDASITLTRAGKIIIKGRYVLSRSSGVNKIKGASVDIN